MVGSFEYNGIKSSAFNLICRSVSRPLLPTVRPRIMQIYGKSGVIDYGGGDYDTRPIVMHIAYIGKSFVELRSRAREIASWLTSYRWAKLIINDEPDKYYLARVVSGINFETMKRLGQADITFECQPFAYMAIDTGADPTWDEADFPWMTYIPWDMVQSYRFTATGLTNYTFENPGTQEIGCNSPQGSKFDIIVSGSWTTLEISLNGKSLEYTEAGSGTLIIDNVEMEAKLDGVNKLSKLDGDIDSFLIAIPGENTIEINGTGLNVTVTIDFTPMWL
jgi:predicted phage tail component-like protein